MPMPCPLYFKAADLLAAFSGDLDRPARAAPPVRLMRSLAIRRARAVLSNALRRRSGPTAQPPLDAALAQRTALRHCSQDGADERLRFVGDGMRGGLLSHFSMVQPGA